MTYEEACRRIGIEPLPASGECEAQLVAAVEALVAAGEVDLRQLNLLRVHFMQCRQGQRPEGQPRLAAPSLPRA